MNNSLKRIILDIKDISKDPIPNIYYIPDEQNIQNGHALIIGPENTPYEYGFYFFKFTFKDSYPFSPPKVIYLSNDGITRFNPNYYRTGKVCLSILNTWQGEKWSSCQSLRTVLLTLQMTMNDSPLLNEPGVEEHSHSNCIQTYHNIIQYKNFDFIICNYLEKIGEHNEEFEMFNDSILEKYAENKDKILEKINQIIQDEKRENKGIYNISIYNMKISFDYDKLLERFSYLDSYLMA